MRTNEAGFTLIELMTTITIVAILSMLAAPSFNEAILSNKLTSFANNFVGSSQLARSEAIKRNARVQLCRSTDGTSCAATGTFQQGWIVFHDADANGTVDAGETVLQVQQALSPDYRLTSTGGYSIAFQATGAGATTTALTLCRATPAPGGQERLINLSPTGRTSVTTTRTGACG